MPDAFADARRLAALVHAHWGIRPARLWAIDAGHTNKTFGLDADDGPAILRVSWPGKPAAQVEREARLLRHLRDASGLPQRPSPRPTRQGQSAMCVDGRWLHLFETIAGQAASDQHPDRTVPEALRTLGSLHQALHSLPTTVTRGCAWLHARLKRVRANPAPALPPGLSAQYDDVLTAIERHLHHADTCVQGTVQWLHGDYHAGNLLFLDGALQGILDFDDPGEGAPALEASLALFALTRDARRDDRLVYDTAHWDVGLRAYAAQCPGLDAARLLALRPTLLPVFCADQVLIHLEAAQRGLWALKSGIGFLGCWRSLLHAPSPPGW